MLVEVRTSAGLLVFAVGVGGLGALAALAVWTLRSADPLVPLELLRRPGLVAANVVTIAVYATLSAQLVFLPVFLQFVGFSPVPAGLAFSIPSLGLVLLAARAGRLADRFGPRRPIAIGAAVVGIAQLLLLLAHDERSTWIFGTLSLLLLAVGLAGIVSPITAAALSPAPQELAGVASGLNQTAARAGGVVSIAAVGALAGWVFARAGGLGTAPFDPALTGASRDAGVRSFHAVVLVVFGLACLSAVLAATLLRDRERR
jgi:MFS family permease